MNSNEPDDTLLRLTLPLLEIDARSLPVSTEMFVKSLNEYINQERDRTGLRLFSLIDQAKMVNELKVRHMGSPRSLLFEPSGHLPHRTHSSQAGQT